jgi:hypothetical protein
MPAEKATVERALAFVTACQIDSNCALGLATAVEPEVDRSSHSHVGLKVGLAMSLFTMTVISSVIPAALMRLPMYNVRHLPV